MKIPSKIATIVLLFVVAGVVVYLTKYRSQIDDDQVSKSSVHVIANGVKKETLGEVATTKSRQNTLSKHPRKGQSFKEFSREWAVYIGEHGQRVVSTGDSTLVNDLWVVLMTHSEHAEVLRLFTAWYGLSKMEGTMDDYRKRLIELEAGEQPLGTRLIAAEWAMLEGRWQDELLSRKNIPLDFKFKKNANRLVQLYAKDRKFSESENVLNKMISWGQPETAIYSELKGRIQASAGKTKEANTTFSDLASDLQQGTKDEIPMSILYNVAFDFKKLGDREKAMVAFDHVSQHHPIERKRERAFIEHCRIQAQQLSSDQRDKLIALAEKGKSSLIKQDAKTILGLSKN